MLHSGVPTALQRLGVRYLQVDVRQPSQKSCGRRASIDARQLSLPTPQDFEARPALLGPKSRYRSGRVMVLPQPHRHRMRDNVGRVFKAMQLRNNQLLIMINTLKYFRCCSFEMSSSSTEPALKELSSVSVVDCRSQDGRCLWRRDSATTMKILRSTAQRQEPTKVNTVAHRHHPAIRQCLCRH